MLNHIEFNGENFVVKERSVVFRNSLLGVLWSIVSHSGRAQELSKLVSVKATHLQFTNLLEKFLQIVVSDLFLINVSNLKSYVGGSQHLGSDCSWLITDV